MPVPSAITDLSQTPGSNSPAGSESPALLDDYTRTVFAFIAKLRDGQGLSNPVDLASAATTDIGGATSPIVRITGTTTITSFGANYAGPRFLTFAGALTLTHNATSLILPGGANITTAAGDCAIAVPNLATPSGWRVICYTPAALAPGGVSSVVPISLGGTGQATAAAAFNAIKQAATDTATGVVELLTNAEAQAGTDTTRAMTAAALKAAQIQLGTSVATTSGTAIDFTGIPSFPKRVTVLFNGVSTNGTDTYLIQLGSASFLTSGYLGTSVAIGNATVGSAVSNSAGFSLGGHGSAASVFHGKAVIELVSGNTYSFTAVLARSDAPAVYVAGGTVTLSGVLDRVRLTTTGGTNTFDAGAVNISWE